ncbi:MAG TPA: dTDP-4-amino-4,6-dideoxygalactose transaminase [Methanothrix sp.]|nr:dTDP-4-amino-4,6-dideoxygalactose transaminase [Methanothrix sp.]
MKIPFNRPCLTGKECEYVCDAIERTQEGSSISGDGPYTQKAQEFLESRFGAKKALLTTSCTSALELATHLLNLRPGDEVILPSFTFVSTANPIVIAGARPVFAEISEDTCNIDPDDIRKKITPRTRAIYPVHYGGVACPMDEIMEIAQDHDLKVVEDAAQGVNAKYKNKYLGTIGDLGCYSFHETKNYTCGEGGALLINSDDKSIWERAEIIREKGTNRSKFFRGEVDKYTWVDIGSSYLPSDILAAFLYAQLENMDEIKEKRMRIWQAYYSGLKPLEGKGMFRLPFVPEYAEHNAHLFYVMFNTASERDAIMEKLRLSGIHAVFHYLPLHTSPMGERIGYKLGDLMLTERVSERILRLPIYTKMKRDELTVVLDSLIKCMHE